ncbi:MAG: bifunctional 3-(3-hydroxy-phenyl)propionate/3-hydroxycinnamic acid hydroxylase MhpA [Brevundimonas sp.]
MSSMPECDVLVIGLGPVGATLSALLAQQGVKVIAIDKSSEIYPLPRAVHFDHEIMRVFQQLGIAEQVQQHARNLIGYEFRDADRRPLMQISPPAETPSGWSLGYLFHQPGLELALRDTLAASPNADVRTGWALDSFEQTSDHGVVASVTGPDGPRSIHARYMVGCDGAGSLVRKVIGCGLSDYQFDEGWLVVDVKVGPDCRLSDLAVQICDPERPTSCVPSGPGRHRWEFMLRADETPEAMLDDAIIQGLIDPWDCGPVEIERKAVYRFHGLVANCWRDGQVLMAGDAAHQTPPFAGQGMCAGVRDAVNLAWKLKAVISGAASPALLDTYQQEREPHVKAAIELAIGLGRIVCTQDREVAAMRDKQMRDQLEAGTAPTALPELPSFAEGCLLPNSPQAGTIFPQPCCDEGGRRLRMDDLLGADACLITRGETGPTVGGVKVFGLQSDELAPFRTRVLAWLDEHGAEAVLVRPDRYVFGTDAPAALIAAWALAISPLKNAA